MKIYVVVELEDRDNKYDRPKMIGAFKKQRDAEKAAYGESVEKWRNIIPVELK